MIILVDYDNLPRIYRERGTNGGTHGIHQLANKLLELVGPKRIAALSNSRVRIKLYGGWFENNQLSNKAQRLSANVSSSFPTAMSISDAVTHARALVRVDMGYSLEIEPSVHLLNTFRRREFPKGLRCDAPPIANCGNTSSCAINNFYSVISNEECSDTNCSVQIGSILTRHEQKLVDTMMVADMIHIATIKTPEFVIVSSDDDLWVGIKTALLLGTKVLHLHTIPGRTTPSHYKAGVGNNYQELNMY